MEVAKLCDALVDWLKERINEAGARGAVFGLSGGIDSAVVGALCKRAFPENCLGLIMPCYSNSKDEEDAVKVAEKFGIPHKKIVLDGVYDEFLNILDKTDNRVAVANIKPRLRMITLYYYATLNNYLVVGTGNKSELTVGYFTKYGDGGVDLLPLGNLVKKQVRELAVYLGIPRDIIEKPPTGGLWEGQTDEGEMGITYEELDNFILTGKARPEIAEKIKNMNRKSEHKRNLPPIPAF
ncbi:NAD+ synthase [Thermosediminibacter oceani]|uniref:NH(3)-dependent NAD(+) synthetase n=1 Tax=Thermosediminibacter oceani (strain ATCC BAA-1034 / DSM 16646 / JW/IW-1228P) TaxID=555079 RepID=D9RXR6_THEOJ|nr:NAD+ synthase [Thermosediminibacter oceani]ADL08140.1 NH(3)-dependent NAD(+) synthetase [Thermosediminibacter oceani DSM 16646]